MVRQRLDFPGRDANLPCASLGSPLELRVRQRGFTGVAYGHDPARLQGFPDEPWEIDVPRWRLATPHVLCLRNPSLMVTNPLFYAAAIPALLISGISKGGFAGGLGILAVPLMSLTMPPTQVTGIMLPCLILMDLMSVWAYRRSFDGRNLLILLPSALIGNALGTLTFSRFDDRLVGFIIGLIAVAFTLDAWLRQRLDAPPAPRSILKGTFWGTVAGYTSFVSHAGSPPLNMYLLPQRLDKSTFAGTSIMYFTFVNLTKVPSFYALGQLSRGNLLTALVLSPLAPAGVAIGVWLHGRINPTWFFRVIYLLVFGSGLKLGW